MSGSESSAEAGTRERILDAAEALFGEKGFESVSLRDITGRAGANVASVNYHFGSKDKLIAAVIERHAVPINEERLRCLAEAEARPKVENVLLILSDDLKASAAGCYGNTVCVTVH